jgi:hypothetical protein
MANGEKGDPFLAFDLIQRDIAGAIKVDQHFAKEGVIGRCLSAGDVQATSKIKLRTMSSVL